MLNIYNYLINQIIVAMPVVKNISFSFFIVPLLKSLFILTN